MLELIFKNDFVKVSGDYTKEIINIINETCSYKVPDAQWSEKFQEKKWDGTISLFNKWKLMFPSGLLNIVECALKESKINYIVLDERTLPVSQKFAQVDLGEHSFRDYQLKAIEAFKQATRGIIAVCTGGGKTKTSCGIISDLSVYPVVFVVPSVSLLKQTVAEFKKSLKPLDNSFGIGEVGGGICNIFPNGVNVCTYQTILTAFDQKYFPAKNKIVDLEKDKNSLESLETQLKILEIDYKNSPNSKLKGIKKKITEVNSKIKSCLKTRDNKAKIRELIETCQLLIVDETHIAAVILEHISAKSISAYYKCGLTATPQRTDNQDLRMFGATGSVIFKISASELIQKGYLVKPYIYGVDLDFLDKTSISYPETYKNAIVFSEQRNNLIKKLAENMHEEGRPTLILVERIDHGNIFQSIMNNCVFVPGGDGSDDKPITDEELDYRKSQLNRLERNEIILCATQWANQGIDAPKVGCLILAGSTASPITVIQQVGRVLRKAEGKEDCIVFDFKMKEKSLRSHFYSRLKALKNEPEFVIKILKYNIDKGTYV